MGIVCSLGKKNSVVSTSDGIGPKHEETGRTQYSISSSIICSSIWNPFRVSRDEAEILLQDTFPGAFVFSHNITSEIFVSMSTGKYVCHHPILKFSQHCQVGGRDFKNVEEAILFYRRNPLGDAVLTEQFNPLNNEKPESRSRQSPIISSPPTVPKSKTKRVTFEVSPKQTSTSINAGIGSEMSLKTTQTTMLVDSEQMSGNDKQQQELFKKLQNKPRKSICRVQPDDSLSTSSGNLFEKEEF